MKHKCKKGVHSDMKEIFFENYFKIFPRYSKRYTDQRSWKNIPDLQIFIGDIGKYLLKLHYITIICF